MSNIPTKLLQEILADPYYKICARHIEGDCQGRITFEHAIIFAGRQLQKKFAILPICAYHHEVDEFQDGGGMNKELHIYLALRRATDSELNEINKVGNYFEVRKRLALKYPEY
jgi:hypothetical protein